MTFQHQGDTVTLQGDQHHNDNIQVLGNLKTAQGQPMLLAIQAAVCFQTNVHQN